MPSSLSSLIDNLSERFHKGKCKTCKTDLDYVTVKENTLTIQCIECNKKYEKEFNKDLSK